MPGRRGPERGRGRLERSMVLPKRQLPRASPPMKEVKTVLTAKVVDPKIKISMRTQSTFLDQTAESGEKKQKKMILPIKEFSLREDTFLRTRMNMRIGNPPGE